MSTPHFTLEEFVASSTAAARRIDNALPARLRPMALRTFEMLERIRAYLSYLAGHDVPMHISSGYRCADLNAAVGGSRSSDHVFALAADWTAPAFGTPLEICRALVPKVDFLGIGQLINEAVGGAAWVHTSTGHPLQIANRVITITNAGAQLGIQET